MKKKDPLESLNQKERAQWSTSWAWLLETEVSTKPIVPQNLFAIPNNRVMSMEHLFQKNNKQMLETTYILILSQLLKIAPNFKKYMWHKLKPKKQK